MIPFKYSVRSLLVRGPTTAAASLGLGLVVFVFASTLMLVHGLTQATRRAVDPQAVIVLRAGASAEIESHLDQRRAAAIAAAPEVAHAADGQPLALGEWITLLIVDDVHGRGSSNVVLRGVPDRVRKFRPAIRIVAGRAPRPGAPEAMVGKGIRGRFVGLDVGQRLWLRKNRPLDVVGVFEADGSAYESEIWTALDQARTSFGQPAALSSVRVRLRSPQLLPAFRAALRADPELGVTALSEADFAERQTQTTARFVAVLGFLVALAFACAASLGALITLHAAVAQRSREIATLRALGFSRLQLMAAWLFEAGVIGLAGGALGAGASLLLAAQRISMLNTVTWSEVAFAFEPSPAILLGSIALAVLLGMFGGVLPALRAARIDPATALQ